MIHRAVKVFGLFCAFAALSMAKPATAQAAELGPEYEASSSLTIMVDAPEASLYAAASVNAPEVTTLAQGESCQVIEDMDGWVKVSVDGSEGYLDKSQGTMVETVNVTQDPSVSLRQDVVDYALQFVGNPYRYGGRDPNTGVDCSGFTRYVMQNAAGVSLNRSSSSQATQGRTVSAAEMQPGDLIFYGNGSRVNHVAMYIGDGQIVHASTERTGIKVSNWNYRTPVRIASVLG